MTATGRDDALLQAWQSACRSNELLSRFPPPTTRAIVTAVADRVLGVGGPPDQILAGLASGLAATDWQAKGEVVQTQLGLLMEAVAFEAGANILQVARVHTVVSAAVAGVAVEAWRNRAEVDELTALRNRGGWDTDSAAIQSRAQSISYASIDLDGLKSINDGPGGHAAGDELLRGFAHRLSIAVKSLGGVAYRYGGDEFSAVLETEIEDLGSVLDTLQETEGIAAFSFGVAKWPDEDQDLPTVVTLADRRMYEQKTRRKSRLTATSSREGVAGS